MSPKLVINNSKELANIVRSVSDNLVSLGWVLYLFIVTIIVYSQYGVQYFYKHFSYSSDDDGAQPACRSVVSCGILIAYHGVPNGGLDGNVLTSLTHSTTIKDGEYSNMYIWRVLFDLSFFIWVGLILFNIITGLLVDGFGAHRDEDAMRKDIIQNACFVCGKCLVLVSILFLCQVAPSFFFHFFFFFLK